MLLNLRYSYNYNIHSAYVITLEGNSLSERLSQRCIGTAKSVGMQVCTWKAFDGTGNTIIVPEQAHSVCELIKQSDFKLSTSEVACALSHISLWAHCLKIDQPIIVFEHDAVVIKNITNHPVYGAINYLGCKEQITRQYEIHPTPPHASIGNDFRFIFRAHAYSIDPIIAKNLLAYVITNGINESLDLIIRADLFPIIQTDLYAYDSPDQSTITNRKI